MLKIANKNASEYTTDKLEFAGNNTFARWENGAYVVYSYGDHFPMYVYRNNQWYENSDKYSITTSKQQTQCRPYLYGNNSYIQKANTSELKLLISVTCK
tara:strand:+ start:266 stop:562 length:297 start_codon:yes stop_codon:yes gene_type:complete